MPNTIAENLQRLKDSRTAIGNAIIAKGGTVNEGDGFEEFPADIATIPSGTTLYKLITNDENVYNYALYCYVDNTYSVPRLIVTGWLHSNNGRKEFSLADGLTFGDLGITDTFTIRVGTFVDSSSTFYYWDNEISPTSNKIIASTIGPLVSVSGFNSFT